MNPKLFLVGALFCLYIGVAYATFPLTLAGNGLWLHPASLGFASAPAAATSPSIALAGGATLLGGLGLVIAKALILRRLTGVSLSTVICHFILYFNKIVDNVVSDSQIFYNTTFYNTAW